MITSAARMDIDSKVNARSRLPIDDVFWQNIVPVTIYDEPREFSN